MISPLELSSLIPNYPKPSSKARIVYWPSHLPVPAMLFVPVPSYFMEERIMYGTSTVQVPLIFR